MALRELGRVGEARQVWEEARDASRKAGWQEQAADLDRFLAGLPPEGAAPDKPD